MSGQEKSGMGAEVGARKISGDGTTEQVEGSLERTPALWAYIVFWVMAALSLVGLWKIAEVLLTIV